MFPKWIPRLYSLIGSKQTYSDWSESSRHVPKRSTAGGRIIEAETRRWGKGLWNPWEKNQRVCLFQRCSQESNTTWSDICCSWEHWKTVGTLEKNWQMWRRLEMLGTSLGFSWRKPWWSHKTLSEAVFDWGCIRLITLWLKVIAQRKAGWWWLEHDWYIFPYIGYVHHPNWHSYFSDGLKPLDTGVIMPTWDWSTLLDSVASSQMVVVCHWTTQELINLALKFTLIIYFPMIYSNLSTLTWL